HVQGPGAEILAAATACAVLCVSNLQPGSAVEGQGPNAAMEQTFATSPAATARARGAAGGATNPGDQVGEHGRCPRGGGEVSTASLRRRPSIFQAQKELRSLNYRRLVGMSEKCRKTYPVGLPDTSRDPGMGLGAA